MTLTRPAPPPGRQSDGEEPRPRQGWQVGSPLALTMVLLLVVAAQGPVRQALSAPVMQSWMTVFVAVVVQALPFLVLGVLLSAVIAVFVPASFFARALPKRPALAVPVAGRGRSGPAGLRVRVRAGGRARWCGAVSPRRRRWRSCCPRRRSTRSC